MPKNSAPQKGPKPIASSSSNNSQPDDQTSKGGSEQQTYSLPTRSYFFYQGYDANMAFHQSDLGFANRFDVPRQEVYNAADANGKARRLTLHQIAGKMLSGWWHFDERYGYTFMRLGYEVLCEDEGSEACTCTLAYMWQGKKRNGW